VTEKEIENTRQKKARYVWAFFASLLLRVCQEINNLVFNDSKTGQAVISTIGILVALFTFVATWQFCRALKVNKFGSFLNAMFSPFIFVLQAIFLLQFYVKRTGIKLTFLLADKIENAQPAAASDSPR
jgi:hypothetical protein